MDKDLEKMLEADAQNEATAVDLAAIYKLVARQLKLEGELDALEAKKKEVTKALNKVRDEELPQAMKSVKLTTVVTDDGHKVDVKEELTASVPAKRKEEIISKLREMGHGDMVTNTITISVGKGDDNKAPIIMAEAEKIGLTALRAEDVNTGTLKAMIRDRLDKGETVDLPFFGAHLVRRAKISQ